MAKGLSMNNRGLRYKLLLSFSLMSLIPILAFTYIISVYLFPQIKELIDVSVIALLAIVVSILGLLFGKSLIDPVVRMALEAQIIASGDYEKRVNVVTDDEVGNLGASINAMTQRIKDNLKELKGYSQKIREINVEVNRKTLALSSLLQIGDIISKRATQIDSVLDLAVEKATMVFESGFGILYLTKDGGGDYLVKVANNIEDEKLENIVIKQDGQTILNKIVKDRNILAVDSRTKISKDMEGFLVAHHIRNVLFVPIYSGKNNFGLLLIGTRVDDFKFRPEDIDLVKVFAKQITIAIETDVLTRKTEELAIRDELTDLYNKNYIVARLEDEIKRAIFYQRPCSFIMFNIDNFETFRQSKGEIMAEEVVKSMARIIKESATPVAKVARIGGNDFVMLLPEKNKKEAMYIAEEVRKKAEATNLLKEDKAVMTLSGGVSENPIDGTTSDELYKRAEQNMRQAKALGKNRIVA